MSNPQRRYVTNERSSQKETRPSYQPLTLSSHSETNIPTEIPRYGSSTHLLVVPTSNRMKYSDVPRSPSANQLKSREEHIRGSIARRRNEGVVSNLKSELQNLKLEVSRIMNKDTDYPKASSSRDSGVYSNYDEYELGESKLSLRDYGKDVSDSVSVTSEKVIDQPLRKLEMEFGSENYDHTHFLELEANLLKTELRNLKNKYNSSKQEWRQKCQALQKKCEYLEVSLRRSQESLRECKKNLQVQIQTIKFQLNRKFQQQIEEDQIKSQRTMMIEKDIGGGNELIQEKLKKLYEQLNEKSRIINNMNLEFNDIRGEIQKKSFELRKQLQKNNQFSKQLEFARRENSRNQTLLQQEVNKKNELFKTVETLRQKNNEMSKQLDLKDKIVISSESMETKLSTELKNYKQNQQRLQNENYELLNELRKQRELSNTNQQQIRHLKQTVQDFTSQIQQLSKITRQQKERNMQIEQSYRKMIDEIKANNQAEQEELQRQFDRFRHISTESNFEKQEELKQRVDTDIKEKDRQISKWKAQYKMLKIKFEEFTAIENAKKEEIETYYRNYKEYKTKNKVLQMRNKVLENSANDYIQKIQDIETANLAQRAQYMQTINNMNMHCQQLDRRCQQLESELMETRDVLNSEAERAYQQQSYRKSIEQKVLTLDIENHDDLMEIIQKVKKRVDDQDEKVNKYIKESKNKDVLVSKLRQEIRDVMQSQEKQLEHFRSKQIADMVHQIQSKTFVSLEQLKTRSKNEIEIELNNNTEILNENTRLKGQVAELTKNLMEIKQQTIGISHLYNIKSLELEQIRDKHKQQIDNYQQRIEEQLRIKNNNIKNLQAQINIKNEQNISLRNQVKMLNTTVISMNRQTFDEALKNQIDASKKLRQEMNKKNEEVYRVRDMHAQLKAQYDNIKSQNDITKLKSISEKKNIQVQFEVEVQQLKNQLQVEQKKVSSLEQKIKLVIDENKKKDNFIQTYIMGKKLPTNQREFVTAFLKEYEICVTGKNLAQKLQSQSQQLEKMTVYNFNLMKQIAGMKQKMLLYEAISENNSQLSKSISEFESPTRKFEFLRSNTDTHN